MKVNLGGDDLFINRLFSYLQKQLIIPIKGIKPIRKQVYLIESSHTDFILKGFPTYHRLKLQEEFVTLLKKEGFEKTYCFYPFAQYPPLMFENIYFGCLEYLHPSQNEFSYRNRQDQSQGLSVLTDFHHVTINIAGHFEGRIPRFKQFKKWNERMAQFLNHLPIIQYYVPKDILNELLVWANWSLKGMQAEALYFEDGKTVILHGDVAHHNFLRTSTDDVFLIDFDLISQGLPQFDYLQYANRILPFLNWSVEELTYLPAFLPYLKEKGFLYGLSYPTDIFREWNRAIREKTYLQQGKIQYLLEMTVGKFKERQTFFRELNKLVHNGHNWTE